MQEEKSVYYPKKNLLTCRLCTDIFKKPVTLTCGHTFCYNCLYKFMKQNTDPKPAVAKQFFQKKKSQQNKKCLSFQVGFVETQNKKQDQENDNIPLPLCPICCSLIFKPIKSFKENMTLTNLIQHAKYKPQLNVENIAYDEQLQSFDHKILINIKSPKAQPLPFAHSEIKFNTCFIDDILQQSHSSYVVIEWPGFKRNIGLAGKIQRAFIEYHSSSQRSKQNHYSGTFTGMFFVNIQKRKLIEINLKSRYYTEATLFADEEIDLAPLTICKCEPFHSQNIQPLTSFQPFLYFYDKLNNHHYLNQIYRLIDPNPLFERNNPQNMIYSCIRILKLKTDQRKQIIQSFDDAFRIQKINEFLQRMQHLPVQEFIQISIPGKYNSAFVFGVILVLILLHYMQTN